MAQPKWFFPVYHLSEWSIRIFFPVFPFYAFQRCVHIVRFPQGAGSYRLFHLSAEIFIHVPLMPGDGSSGSVNTFSALRSSIFFIADLFLFLGRSSTLGQKSNPLPACSYHQKLSFCGFLCPAFFLEDCFETRFAVTSIAAPAGIGPEILHETSRFLLCAFMVMVSFRMTMFHLLYPRHP
jgi:hypothetical protein